MQSRYNAGDTKPACRAEDTAGRGQGMTIRAGYAGGRCWRAVRSGFGTLRGITFWPIHTVLLIAKSISMKGTGSDGSWNF
jgi:hypothetical protein